MSTAVTDAATTSSFNTSSFSSFKPGASSAFVPKSKQAAAPSNDFPTLGGDVGKQQPKKLEKKEPEDPCHGKPKEFFIYEMNPVRNVCICLPEHMEFIAIHYSEHYFNPIDILMWLYDMAEYRDDVIEQKRLDDEYNKGPIGKGKPVQTKGRKHVKDDSEEEEESSFGYKLPKKRPAAIAKPV